MLLICFCFVSFDCCAVCFDGSILCFIFVVLSVQLLLNFCSVAVNFSVQLLVCIYASIGFSIDFVVQKLVVFNTSLTFSIDSVAQFFVIVFAFLFFQVNFVVNICNVASTCCCFFVNSNFVIRDIVCIFSNVCFIGSNITFESCDIFCVLLASRITTFNLALPLHIIPRSSLCIICSKTNATQY